MSEPRTGQCTGQCCSIFWINGDSISTIGMRGLQGHMIAEMLIQLPTGHKAPVPAGFGALNRIESQIENGVFTVWGEECNAFTCKHWDPKTTLCGIYDTRPEMCSDYPYGTQCNWCGMLGPQLVKSLLCPPWTQKQLAAGS